MYYVVLQVMKLRSISLKIEFSITFNDTMLVMYLLSD